MWPTAHPQLKAERGEPVSFSLRIRPQARAVDLEPSSDSVEGVRYQLRRYPEARGYWLDVSVNPFDEPGSHTRSIRLRTAGPASEALTVTLTVEVPAESLVVTPTAIDLGRISLTRLKTGLQRGGRLGIRKVAGSFRIKSLSSTLPFLKVEAQPIVEGSNYLIKVSVASDTAIKTGTYEGLLRIETDDARRPRVEIPVKVVISDE